MWDNAKNPKNLNLGGIADGPLCTYLSKDYLSGAGSLPVASAVHVETVVGQDGSFFIDTVAESRFVLADTASAFGQRPVGVVAFVDISKDDAGAVLDAHADALGKAFRGVRMILNHSPTWPQVPHARFVGGDAAPRDANAGAAEKINLHNLASLAAGAGAYSGPLTFGE